MYSVRAQNLIKNCGKVLKLVTAIMCVPVFCAGHSWLNLDAVHGPRCLYLNILSVCVIFCCAALRWEWWKVLFCRCELDLSLALQQCWRLRCIFMRVLKEMEFTTGRSLHLPLFGAQPRPTKGCCMRIDAGAHQYTARHLSGHPRTMEILHHTRWLREVLQTLHHTHSRRRQNLQIFISCAVLTHFKFNCIAIYYLWKFKLLDCNQLILNS